MPDTCQNLKERFQTICCLQHHSATVSRRQYTLRDTENGKRETGNGKRATKKVANHLVSYLIKISG